MARSIAIIQAGILAIKNAQSALSGLTSPSQVAIYRAWIFIQAVTINLFEQAQDIFKADLEAKIKVAAVGSESWVQDRVLNFQYDATTPQVLEVLSDFSINYPTIDSTKRIITRCSVVTTGQRVVLIKVAKSDPPVPLISGELSSLTGYLSNIDPVGVNYVLRSLVSDKIYIAGTIFYNGQYAAVIQANIIITINLYLASIPFNGSVKLSTLESIILSVIGVTDILLTDVAIRADATLFTNKTYLIQNQTTIIPIYPTYAGYIVEETTSGNTFTDRITFIAQ